MLLQIEHYYITAPPGLAMPYMRRDRFNAEPSSRPVYADPETEKILLKNGFVKASGAPYYNRGFVKYCRVRRWHLGT